MRLAHKLAGISGLLVFFASFALAATITGTVKGPDGAPFEGAFVQAQNTKTRVVTDVLSNKQGQYRVEGLPAGDYRLQIRATGYKASPKTGVSLTAEQNASYDFALEKGMVRWNDLSLYQGEKLLPNTKGKETLFGTCFACHGFETRMASVSRDEDGWRDRVQYMREAMKFFIGGRFTDQNATDVAAYLNSLWGPDSTLAKSPADLPAYQETVRPFSSQAMNIAYVEYELPGPNRMPWSAAPDKDGKFWMPYYGRANKIGRLDPKTAQVDEFAVPNETTAAIHSAVPAPDGSVWLTEQGSNKLGHWDPATQKITEYQDSYLPGKEGTTAGGSKHTTRVDPKSGIVWATGSPLTSFDPKTQKFTHYDEVPSAYGLDLDKEGNLWFAEFRPDGKIGKVDPKTGKVTKYQQPTANGRPRRLLVDADQTIWFAEFAAGKLVHFDPKTEAFKEYQLPGPSPTPYAIGIDREDHIWYASEHMDVVGRLDPSTGQVTEYPFPHSENTMREFFRDSEGRMWWASPANNKAGYFYLAGQHGGSAAGGGQ